MHILTYAYNSRHQLTGITGLPALNASSGIAANAQQQFTSVIGHPALNASSGISAIPSAAGSPNADSSSVSGYDPAGNPTSYRGASLNWFRGRMLKSCTLPGGTNISYAYDANGIRVSKQLGDTTHFYFTEGSRIRAEKRVYAGQASPELPGALPPSDILTYIYDASGITGLRVSPSGTSSSAAYFFLKNQQGDIKFIVDANGSTLNEYVYDAWGNHKIYKYLNGTILTDSSGNPIDIHSHSDYTNDIGNLNPFRYRSYYFDPETGWYYLNSRYYDPQARRFLNADDPSVPSDQATIFGGLNLYSYCLNNPVNMVDPSGNSPKWWESILIGLAIIATAALIGAAIVSTGGTAVAFLAAWKTAAIAGLKIASVAGLSAGIVRSGVSALNGNSIEDIGKSFILGFSDGFLSGSIYAGASMILGPSALRLSGKFNNGYGWRIGKWQGGYQTPQTPGIGIFAHQGGVNGGRSFSTDLDIYHGLHFHTNKFGPKSIRKSKWIKIHHWAFAPIIFGIGIGLSDGWSEW